MSEIAPSSSVRRAGRGAHNAVIIAAAVLAVAVVVSSTISFLEWRQHRADEQAVKPMKEMLLTLAIPTGSTIAFEDSETAMPLRLVRGWRTPGTIDETCSLWGNSYRKWIGENHALGTVTGESLPGSSCVFQAPKGAYKTSLTVAVYGVGMPEATLSIEGT